MESRSHGTAFTLRDVVNATGLTRQLLHTWERRYKIVEPRRGKNEVRLYSDEEVLHLQLLKRCVDKGHRIGSIASLETEELKRLARARESHGRIPLADILAASKSHDVDFVERRLVLHFTSLGPLPFIQLVVVPLMAELGSEWQQDRMPVASEHVISGIVRTLLGQGLRLTERHESDPVAVFTTVEGELHEIGLLCAAILAQDCGFRAIFAGPQLPVDAMLEMCAAVGASLLGIGISAPTASNRDRVREIADRLPDGLELWLGGPQAKSLHLDHPRDITVIDDELDLEAAFQRFRIRATRAR